MPDKITFYAIVGSNSTHDNPHGLARRLETDWGFTDEALRDDFSWSFTPVIVEWERGDFAHELVGSAISKRTRSFSISASIGAGSRLTPERRSPGFRLKPNAR